jgi:hypothetical protein
VQWRERIVKKHEATYRKFLVEVLIAYELRASNSHEGYLETRSRHDALSKDYEKLHTYVEQDLLPEIALLRTHKDSYDRKIPVRLARKLKALRARS